VLTFFYWLTRWPFVGAAVAFFIFAQLLPAFTWYLRTPLLLGASLIVLIVFWGIRQNIQERLVMRTITDGTYTEGATRREHKP
jgi:hypothetical protein